MTNRAVDADRSWQRSQLRVVGLHVLRHQRKKVLKLTQSQIAEKIGVDRSQISRVERGLEMPGDWAMAKAYVEGYQLSVRDKNRWFQILFGAALEDVAYIPSHIILRVMKIMELAEIAEAEDDPYRALGYLREIHCWLDGVPVGQIIQCFPFLIPFECSLHYRLDRLEETEEDRRRRRSNVRDLNARMAAARK